jgi:hypothetical protein
MMAILFLIQSLITERGHADMKSVLNDYVIGTYDCEYAKDNDGWSRFNVIHSNDCGRSICTTSIRCKVKSGKEPTLSNPELGLRITCTAVEDATHHFVCPSDVMKCITDDKVGTWNRGIIAPNPQDEDAVR